MKKRIAKAVIAIGILFIIGIIVWGFDVLQDRKYVIEIHETIGLYPDPDSAAYKKGEPPIATIPPGATVWVRRMVFGKDYQAFRIRLESGQEGWVINDGHIAVSEP